jgi:hypothetical protein
MFSTSTATLLETLGEKDKDEIKLTPDEASVIESCNKIIDNKQLTHSQKLALTIQLLEKFATEPLSLIKMSAASIQIDRIIHQQSPLTSSWGEALVKGGLPGGKAFSIASTKGEDAQFMHGAPIETVDGKAKSHVVDQFVAWNIFTKYKKSSDHNPALLDFACDKGFYPALRQRCDDTRTRIKDALKKQTFPNINTDFEKLNADLKKLGNLYWTVGYLDASKIWLDLAVTYANKMNNVATMESSDPENALWVKTFATAAAENIYCAKILSTSEASQAIIQDLCGNKTTLQQVYQVKDWDAGVDKALATLKLPPAELIELKVQLEKNAEARIAKLQNKPEMKLRQ